MSSPLLEINGLSKSYPGVLACDGITLATGPGEIHAILGENGAGKSTLVKMIYGLVRPDRGSMTLKGRAFAPSEPREARNSGVAMVFQHFLLFDALTVAENIALGMDDPPPPKQLSSRIREKCEQTSLPVNPDSQAGNLAAGERQRVEIVRCLLQNPSLVIMDEPTSVLTPGEADDLFATLRSLAADGVSILYISHKLREIQALCERATILRGGKVVATCDPRKTSAGGMARMMVGDSLAQPRHSAKPVRSDAILQVKDLSLPRTSAFGARLERISFSVRPGEILGIGGVSGNGQSELLAALSGERHSPKGTITFQGRDISRSGPEERRGAGLLSAPEERLGHAASPSMDLVENALLTGHGRMRLKRRGFIDWSASRDFAATIVEDYDVRTPGVDSAASSLSGGNLQKFVIGREILQKPKSIVVDQPTWGVDASAAVSVRQALLNLAEAGCALVVISQDLDELIEISDKFCALNGGRLSAPLPIEGLTREKLGLMLGGGQYSSELQDGADDPT